RSCTAWPSRSSSASPPASPSRTRGRQPSRRPARDAPAAARTSATPPTTRCRPPAEGLRVCRFPRSGPRRLAVGREGAGGGGGVVADPLVLPGAVELLLVAARAVDGAQLLGDLPAVP